MITVLRFMKNFVVWILSLFIVFFFAVKIAGYIVEPLFSKYKMVPIAEEIAYRLQAEMPIPPTHEYLKQFTEQLEQEGIVSNAADVTIDYLQLAEQSIYTVYVDYYKMLPLNYQVRGKVQYDGVTKYHDVEVYVHSSEYVESQELLESKSQPQDVGVEQDSAETDKEMALGDVDVDIDYVERGTDFEEGNEEEVFRIISVCTGDTRIADFRSTTDAQEYAQDRGFNDYRIVDLTEEWRESVEFELPEFSVIVWNKKQASFFTQEEAVTYAQQFDHAEVFVPNTFVWSNVPVSLFEDDMFIRNYESKVDGIEDASNMLNAKLVDLDTGKVIWDNYPRECRTCESAIQEQYE